MKTIVVAGAGKIGLTIADLLAGTQDYRVVLADRSAARFERVSSPHITPAEVDVTDPKQLHTLLQDSYAVLSAVPFNLTGGIAKVAKQTGTHYLDLTEDVAT